MGLRFQMLFQHTIFGKLTATVAGQSVRDAPDAPRRSRMLTPTAFEVPSIFQTIRAGRGAAISDGAWDNRGHRRLSCRVAVDRCIANRVGLEQR